MADEDLQRWMPGHNVLMGAWVIPKDPDAYLFTDASNIGWGAHWNSLTVSGVWLTTEKALHINVLELEAVHLTMLHWLKQLTGLTVLVASDNSTVVCYINKPGETVNITVQTDQEVNPHVPEQQDRAMSTSHSWKNECSRGCPISPNSDVRYRVVPTPFCLPSSHTGVGNSIAGFICNELEP